MLREEYRLRVFENGVLRKVFGTKREEVISGLHTRIVMIYTFHNTLLEDKLKTDEVYGACEKYGRGVKCLYGCGR